MSMSHWWLCLLLSGPVCFISAEYIPPGPAYPCPKDAQRQLLYPCTCENGTDAGLHVRCENVGLAVLSVGIGNIAGLGLPIERLELRECKIGRLFGALLRRVRVRVLHMVDTPLRSIDEAAFEGVNTTLQELYMRNTQIGTFPKEAFRILGNLSILSIDGHLMQSLAQDIFVGSAAAGSLLRLHLPNGLLADIPPEAFQDFIDSNTPEEAPHAGPSRQPAVRPQAQPVPRSAGPRAAGPQLQQYNETGRQPHGRPHQAGLVQRQPQPHRGHTQGHVRAQHGHQGGASRQQPAAQARHQRLPRHALPQAAVPAGQPDRGGGTRHVRGGDAHRHRRPRAQLHHQGRLPDVPAGQICRDNKPGGEPDKRDRAAGVHRPVPGRGERVAQRAGRHRGGRLPELQQPDGARPQSQPADRRPARRLRPQHLRLRARRLPQPVRGLHADPHPQHVGPERAQRQSQRAARPAQARFPQALRAAHRRPRVQQHLPHRQRRLPEPLLPQVPEPVAQRTGAHRAGGVRRAGHTAAPGGGSQRPARPLPRRPRASRLLPHHRPLPQPPRDHLPDTHQPQLDLSYNNLTEVRSKTWPAMNALLSLELEGNRLGEGELAGDSFVPLLTLQRLGLARNGLAAPPWQALNALSSLQYLHLQYNNITTLSKSAFGNLPTTFEVDLSHNALAAVAPGAFRGLPQLLRLRLAHNRLAHLPNGALQGLVALRQLDLSHNELERIDNKTHGLLDDCLSLEEVDLSHNQFGFLSKKTFPSSPWVPYRLRVVDLSNNRLPVLTADLAHGTRTLLRLHLSHNYIDDIRHGVLANLTALQHLDLSHNRLLDLVSRTSEGELVLPRNLSELVVSDNLLRRLPLRALLAAPQLRRLDVRRNALTAFPPDLVRRVRDHDLHVQFEGNNLTCDCSARPLKHLVSRLPRRQPPDEEGYAALRCAEPPALAGLTVAEVPEERLRCAAGPPPDPPSGDDPVYALAAEPDVVFRNVQCSQTAVFVSWLVSSARDVADAVLVVRGADNVVLHREALPYHVRSVTVPVEGELRRALAGAGAGSLQVCVLPMTSEGGALEWHEAQCRTLEGSFASWPRKLSPDRRRVVGRRRGASSGPGGGALALVGDSILLTLCIFIGVCFRRLADIDL